MALLLSSCGVIMLYLIAVYIQGLLRADFAVRSKVVFLLLLIVTPIVGFCNCSMFCCALLCVHSCFAIILMGKTELVALLCLPSWWLVIVVWLFLMVPRVCLQFVVFPDETHLLFLLKKENTLFV